MAHRTNILAAEKEIRASNIENFLAPRGSNANKNSPTEHSSFDSDKGPPSIVQKANAVLSSELNNRASRNTDEIGNTRQGKSLVPETMREGFQQQLSGLGDTLVDSLENLTEQTSQIASQMASTEERPIEGRFPNLSFLKFPLPLTPGKASHIGFTLINDDPNETADFTLNATDLVGRSGHRISEVHITVSPTSGTIPPGESVDGRIEVQVPSDIPSGDYGGLLQTKDSNQLQAVIHLSVGL